MQDLSDTVQHKIAEWGAQIIVGLLVILTTLMRYIGKRAMKNIDDANMRIDELEQVIPSLATKDEVLHCQETLRGEIRTDVVSVKEHIDEGFARIHKRIDDLYKRLSELP